MRKLLLLLPLFSASLAFSQGGHYWSEQYGTRSILMSGSVIGGADDLGAVYYNPGRLALIENAAFLLSANLYELSTLELIDAVDEGKDLNKRSFGGVPGLAAGTFKVGFLPKHHFAYAVLKRSRGDYSFFARTNKEGYIFEKLPGEQLLTGGLILSTGFNEEWMAFTWSYAIKENFSVGITNVYAATSSSKNIELDLQLLYEEKSKVGQLKRNRLIDFQQNGLLWKFGMAWTTSFADLGLTVTTPKINIRGKGNFLYEDFLSGLPDTLEAPKFEFALQGDLPAVHKSPFSIGGGATFKILGKHFLHVSGEWFNSVPTYPIMSANTFVGQSTGEEIGFTLYDEAESVFNYGAGVELVIMEPLSFYASYSSDYSYVKSDVSRFFDYKEEAMNSTFRADINHAGAGFVLKLTRADITLGATYAWARESMPRPVDFPDEDEEGQELFSRNDSMDLRWNRWRFIFSFSVPFLKDVQKKIEEKF